MYVFLCVCVYVCVYVCMSVCCMCVRFVYIYMYVCVRCVYVFMYVYVYICMYMRMDVCVCMCVVCMYVRMYVCIVMFLSLNVAMDVQPRYFKYIDITDPFKVAAVATPDVSNCSGFLIWDVKFPLRKFSTKVLQFIFYFGRMPQLSFIISKTKNCLFLYTKYNFVLYCIIYCTSFLSFQFPWII